MPDQLSTGIFTVIVGMAVINFCLRFVPLAVLSRIQLPPPVMRWLSFVPISVMGALVASEVVGVNPTGQPLVTSPALYASALTMIVFRFSRSFLGATLAGMVSFVILGTILR
jgi:branched-subunit amino acid transport protein